MMVVNCCVSVPFVKRLHSMRMHCYVISVKKWVLLENQHYIPNIEDIFTKFTRHPMNWTNMMSSKGQVYAIKIVDFISKTEGPLYFEQACMYQNNTVKEILCFSVSAFLGSFD